MCPEAFPMALGGALTPSDKMSDHLVNISSFVLPQLVTKDSKLICLQCVSLSRR